MCSVITNPAFAPGQDMLFAAARGHSCAGSGLDVRILSLNTVLQLGQQLVCHYVDRPVGR